MKFSELIQNKKEFNIGFIGGSITEGSGGSKNEYCYVSQVCKRLGVIYENIEFSCVNAGIGGTNSALGMFRMERDLLSKKPDIIFIEFAINDRTLSASGMFMENILLEAEKYSSDVPVVVLVAARVDAVDTYKSAKNSASAKQHYELCRYYNIPIINMGDALYQKAIDEKTPFTDYFTDGVHPNDKGHSAYADEIIAVLNDAEMNTVDSGLPLLYGRRIEEPQLILCNEYANEKWHKSYSTMFNRLPDYIYSCIPGDELEFEFYGSILGIYYTVEKDSGILEYKIDGDEWQNDSLWDKYAIDFGRAHYLTLYESLPPGRHKATIRVSENKEEKSEGYYVRIGAFAVGK